jgi:Receptor family ligand binding region
MSRVWILIVAIFTLLRCNSGAPAYVNIGIHLPFASTAFDQVDPRSPKCASYAYTCVAYTQPRGQFNAAMLMAINEINNKCDGIADNLLKETKLKFAARTAHGSFLIGLVSTLELAESVFGGGVVGCVGPARDGPSEAASDVFQNFKIVQIDYAAFTSTLSSKLNYLYKLRTSFNEANDGNALADIIGSYFHWKRVTVFCTGDPYGSIAYQEFILEAQRQVITIVSTQYVRRGEIDLSKYINSALAVNTYIFVILMDEHNHCPAAYSRV